VDLAWRLGLAFDEMEAASEKSFAETVCLPFLRNSQNADGGWGFHSKSESRVEATCWALHALRAWSGETAALTRGFEFLRSAQLPDGSWPSTAAESSGCWVTSLSCWVLWHTADSRAHVAAGLRWLCQDWPADTTPWRRFLAKFSSQHGVAPINTAYRGWSWTPGTSSWVEPTSFALIALENEPLQSLPSESAKRRALGEGLLYDRMCPGGGWNCGNPLVYGVAGEALVVPTVCALLALRHSPARRENVMSLDWLEREAPSIQSAGSLALAKICLEIYNRDWPRSASSFRALHEKSGFLDSVQVMAWTSLALAAGTEWLGPGVAKAT
jgi:hypothetical protein